MSSCYTTEDDPFISHCYWKGVLGILEISFRRILVMCLNHRHQALALATSYTTASFVVLWGSHLSPPAHTSTVTGATITPSGAQMVSQPVNPTAAASAKSVYGVTEEEAKLRRTDLLKPGQHHLPSTKNVIRRINMIGKWSGQRKDLVNRNRPQNINSTRSYRVNSLKNMKRTPVNQMFRKTKLKRPYLKHQSLHQKGSIVRNVHAEKNNHI